MAILRKPVGYVNSSCVTLMWWVKTLRQSKRKIIVSKVSCHDSLLVVLFFFWYFLIDHIIPITCLELHIGLIYLIHFFFFQSK